MKKEVFLKIVDKLNAHSDKISKLYDLNLDMIEFDDDLHICINLLLTEIYGNEGYEWFSWYMYEKQGNPEFLAWDEQGVPICNNIDELYDYLETNYRGT